MSKRTRIDASREARLWIKEVLLPAGALIVTALSVPEIRQTTSTKMNEAREFVREKINKIKKKK